MCGTRNKFFVDHLTANGWFEITHPEPDDNDNDNDDGGGGGDDADSSVPPEFRTWSASYGPCFGSVYGAADDDDDGYGDGALPEPTSMQVASRFDTLDPAADKGRLSMNIASFAGAAAAKLRQQQQKQQQQQQQQQKQQQQQRKQQRKQRQRYEPLSDDDELFVEVTTPSPHADIGGDDNGCLLYTSPSPRDRG